MLKPILNSHVMNLLNKNIEIIVSNILKLWRHLWTISKENETLYFLLLWFFHCFLSEEPVDLSSVFSSAGIFSFSPLPSQSDDLEALWKKSILISIALKNEENMRMLKGLRTLLYLNRLISVLDGVTFFRNWAMQIPKPKNQVLN